MEGAFDAKCTLQCIVKHLNERGEGLDDPARKESHEGKCLVRHVVECWHLADEILKKLGLIKDELRKFCFSLCITHDLGKLDPIWQMGRRGFRHSERGGKLLEGIEEELARLLPLPNGYQAPLILSTLKHHSSLSTERKLLRRLRSLLQDEELNMPLAVNIADTIGAFKLADILSALNILDFHKLLLSQYEWPKDAEIRIVDGIRHKAEKKCGFDHRKYKLQSEIATSSCRHIAVAAPTGWGKTALGLLRIKHTKPNKVFYVLPTITAIKEFEQTLRDMFGSDYVGEYFYFSDVEYLARQKRSEEEPVYPIDFYRYFIPKIMVTTIDQLLLTTLQFGKYHLRRFNLMKSLLIFDEFHLFTPQMIGALKAVFEDLASIYNFSVLLMSATPSTLYIDMLKNTLVERGGVQVEVLEREYERLRRHNIKCDCMYLIDFIREKGDEFKGKRVLVISNTVDRAVQAYDLLRKAEERKVHLIHSRFAYGDRAEREDKARGADILVSTQVAEVSLDISYEVLITELAPIPSLIQRFGRVNRYDERAKRENVYICANKDEEPYSLVEFISTKDVFPKLEEGLQKEGEKAYLDVLDSYYRILLSQESYEIEEMYNYVKETLRDKDYFYSLIGEEDFSKMFGREPSCLAVPAYYCNKVRRLKEEIKAKGEYKEYEERRRLLAYMKKYFISVPQYIIKEDGKWDDDLQLFIVGNGEYVYEPKRGLVRRKLLRKET